MNTARGALQDIKDITTTQTRDKVAVQVTTTPKGATIIVDGNQMTKKTPSKLSLAPGDYFFHCEFHPSTMTGTLTVK